MRRRAASPRGRRRTGARRRRPSAGRRAGQPGRSSSRGLPGRGACAKLRCRPGPPGGGKHHVATAANRPGRGGHPRTRAICTLATEPRCCPSDNRCEPTGGTPDMADKVLVNLATGLEDSERVTVAFLVAGAALGARQRGRDVPDQGRGPPRGAGSRGRRRLRRLPAARAALPAVRATAGASCWCAPSASTRASSTRTRFVANARVAGATPMLEWLGDEARTVFSY